ncbi:MAG: ABC transporter permease subunit [Lachnospiraceae bacterium]
MFNLFKSEMYRISKTKSFWILNLVLIFIAMIAPGFSGSINQEEIVAGAATTGAMGFLVSLGSSMMYLIIITIFIAGYICDGFEQRTLQDSIAAGGGRGKIMLSKSLGVYATAFVMLLVYSLTYMITIMITKGGNLGIENDVLLRMILAFVAILIQNIAQATLIILVAFALKKVGIVMAIGITFFTVGLMILSLATYRYEWLAKIVNYTPFFGGQSITSGFTAPFGDYFSLIAINAVWVIALLMATYSIFRKSELR